MMAVCSYLAVLCIRSYWRKYRAEVGRVVGVWKIQRADELNEIDRLSLHVIINIDI